MKYTIIAFTENRPGVLYRIADLFLRRKINIDSLTVSETERPGISRFTILVTADKVIVDKVVKQLYRIIEVLKVFEAADQDIVVKELAFIKVSTKNPEKRREVEDLVRLFNAKVTYVAHDFLVVEKSGAEHQIDSLVQLLKPFGIKEFIRSGRIAVMKEQAHEKLDGRFSISKDVSHVALGIDVSAIKKMELLGREQGGVISLAQGIPSFQTPQHIKEAAKRAIDENLVDKYTVGYGIQPLRQAIVKKVKAENNIAAVEQQIIVTHGGIEAMMATFIAICNPEDEVIILTPDYASHITQVQISGRGGRPVFVPLDETKDGWTLNPDRLEAAITQNAKAILICNPVNPTGKVYSQEELKEIARIALQYNLFIITDEMYEYFTYDKKDHISIGSFPEVADRTISIFGVSKSYAMTGWRIGYLVASKKIANHIFKIHDSLVTCPTAVSQYAALAAIEGPKDDVAYFNKEFLKRRKIVMEAMKQTNKLQLGTPQGSYFAFPKLMFEENDYDLAVSLIKEAGVAVVPGSAFGQGGEGHIRISYGCEEDQLREGLKRLINYLNKTY